MILIIVIATNLVGGYLLWALHVRLEALYLLYTKLDGRVRDGEDVISDNFGILTKKLTKLEHEVKDIGRIEPKIKEASKAISRLQRNRE